jgi:hypothetical protein
MSEAKQETNVLNVAVDFEGVSIGDGTGRVGIKIDREHMSVVAADAALCGRRLTGRIVAVPKDVDPDQKHMFEDQRHELSGAFEVKRFSVSPKVITAGLTFALPEIDISEMAHFAKRSGRLIIDSIAMLEQEEEAAADDDQ